MNNRSLLAPYGVFVVLACLLTAFQLGDFIGAVRLGIPIPDVVLFSRTIFFWKEAQLFFVRGNYIPGITYLYGWTWFSTPLLCLVINTCLMGASLKVASEVFTQQFGLPKVTSLAVLINPYILFAMAGPNKEVPLLFLSLLYLRVLGRQTVMRLLLAIGIGIVAAVFRDGYGAFLVLWAVLLFTLRSSTTVTGLTFFACFSASTLHQALMSLLPAFARNVQAADAISATQQAIGGVAGQLPLSAANPFGAAALFMVRLVYNWLYLAINPVLFTASSFTPFLIGWVYWINGLVILIAIPMAVLALLPRRKAPASLRFMSAFLLSTWFMISVSLYVQPRYFIPVLPIAAGVILQSSRQVRRMTIAFGVALVALVVAGNIVTGRTASARPEHNDRADFYQRY